MAPISRRQWRQVACCFVLLAANSFIASGYSIVAVPLSDQFHPSRMVLMLAMTIMAGVSALLSPLAGGLMDRFSLKAIVLSGTLMLSAGYVALSLVTSFTQALVVFGLLIAPANVMMGPLAATVHLTRWFEDRRGRAMGIAIAGIAMGSVVFPPVLQWLLDHYDWRSALQLFAIVLLACTLPPAAMMQEPERRQTTLAVGPDADKRSRKRASGARGIIADPAFWAMAAIVAVVLSGIKGMMTNLAPFAIDLGISGRNAAFLISIYGLCGVVAKLTFAALADHVRPRTLLVVSLIGFGCGMALLGQATTQYWTLAIGVALAGLFGGIMIPLQSLLVPRLFGAEEVGRAMGLISMVVFCALLASPPLFGYIFDTTGSYTAIFMIFSALAFLMLALARIIRLQPRVSVTQPTRHAPVPERPVRTPS